MKLYFMIGLPTEEDERRARDRRASASARARSASASRRRARRGPAEGHRQRLDARAEAAHAVPVVRDGRAEASVVDEAGAGSSEEARGSGVELRMHDARRRVARRHLRARRSHARATCSSARTDDGARFDSWEEQLKLDVWERRVRRTRASTRRATSARSRSRARLPWDHIDVGLEDGFLAARVPQGAEEPALARRAARSRARSSTTRTSRTPTPTRASSSATTAASPAISSAMRTRAHRLPRRSSARRRTARRRARAAAPQVDAERQATRPPPRIEQGEARRYRFLVREGRPERVPLAPRSHPRAAARVPSARAAALLLVGLPPEAGHDLRAGAVARRRRASPRSST